VTFLTEFRKSWFSDLNRLKTLKKQGFEKKLCFYLLNNYRWHDSCVYL